MQIITNPSEVEIKKALTRPVKSFEEIEKDVNPVLKSVKEQGDKALKEITLRFDKVAVEQIQVSTMEIELAASQVSEELKKAIGIAKKNIELFHKSQKSEIIKIETTEGVVCWRKSVPIQKVGFYIPGGTAPLFSTILMLAVPAQIAGCEEVVLCTPPDKEGNINPAILYTAQLCGVTKIYKAGGSQAIAAMAYGTETIPQVYKIFGPGNQYVMAAKQLIAKEGIAIDMPAGPSEVAIIADHTSNPKFVAADLLSQAEHGPDSQVLLVSTNLDTINKVKLEVELQLKALPRLDFAQKSIGNSYALHVENYDKAIKIINQYAPEHLIIATDNAEELSEKIVNAGSIFIGHYTPEAAGDYASGTNHTLPTNGFATAYSGVSLDSFYKKITFQKISQIGIQNLGKTIEVMAENEQLQAHKNAVSVRLK